MTSVKRSCRLWPARLILSVLLCLLVMHGQEFTSQAEEGVPLLQVPGAVHLDSNLSGAPLPPEEIVTRVRASGLKVAIFGDHVFNRLDYAVFPFYKLLKASKERLSVLVYGPAAYLERLEGIAQHFSDMVVLPGVEVTPAYYWDISLWEALADGSLMAGKPGMQVRNFHKHLLVFGLERPEDYASLPMVGYGAPLVYSPAALLHLWPLLLILLGFHRLFRPVAYSYLVGMEPAAAAPGKVRKTSVCLIMVGGLLLVNNFPFFRPEFDQYHGDPGSLPYQRLIDRVNELGGLTFWAHPDATTGVHEVGPVTFVTSPYYEALLTNRDYTGFAVFAEGMKNSGLPGGIWDQVLTEYVHGARTKPAWAIGELDYEQGSSMGETQTVFFVKHNTREEILDALRTGRMYATIGAPGKPRPVLEYFQVWDAQRADWVGMGGIAKAGTKVKIRVKLDIPEGDDRHVLSLISEGKVVWRGAPGAGMFEEIIELDTVAASSRTYYRLDLDSRLIANPVFIEFEV